MSIPVLTRRIAQIHHAAATLTFSKKCKTNIYKGRLEIRGRAHFEALCDEGVISPRDLNLFRFCETAEEGWDIVQDFWRNKEATGA